MTPEARGALIRIAAEMLHSRIDDCVDYPKGIPLWFRHQNNAERRAVNEALASLAMQIRRTVDEAPPYCGNGQSPSIENADRWAKQIADGFPATPVDGDCDATRR